MVGFATRTFASTVELANRAIEQYGIPSTDTKIVDFNTDNVYNLDGSIYRTAPAAQDGTSVPGSTQDRAQQQAQGSNSLPSGQARWLILDRNGREVYSFVGSTAQRDANDIARNWLSANAQDGQGPYDVVPVT